jgi:hypothetical protein
VYQKETNPTEKIITKKSLLNLSLATPSKSEFKKTTDKITKRLKDWVLSASSTSAQRLTIAEKLRVLVSFKYLWKKSIVRGIKDRAKKRAGLP